MIDNLKDGHLKIWKGYLYPVHVSVIQKAMDDELCLLLGNKALFPRRLPAEIVELPVPSVIPESFMVT